MKWIKRILIGLFSLVLLLVLLDIGANLWIKYRLPGLINEKNKSAYAVSYKNLEISLLESNLIADSITIVPKSSLGNSSGGKAGIYAQVPRLEVSGVELWSLLWSDRIRARRLTVSRPDIVLYKKNEKAITNPRSIRSQVVEPFEKIIAVSDIYVFNGNIKIVYVKSNKPILSVNNINLNIDGVVIDEQTLAQTIPFRYKKYGFRCDSLYYKPGKFYFFKTGMARTTATGMQIKDFNMIPEMTRKQFVSSVDKEKDLFTILARQINVRQLHWGFEGDAFSARATLVDLDRVSADIYRSKQPRDDHEPKKLYSQMLRELKFQLKVDTLRLRNSLLVYEEEKSFEKGSGKLLFDKFNLTATNVCSALGHKKLRDTRIMINCKFMGSAKLNVNWGFNVKDKSDAFRIRGAVYGFDAQRIVPFTKPYMNVTTKGLLDEVLFDFRGNSQKAGGPFAIRYSDFKVTVYKKNNREKKNKLLTAIGNLFIKNDSKGGVKNVTVEADRLADKSFFNFLWRCLLEGLKKVLL